MQFNALPSDLSINYTLEDLAFAASTPSFRRSIVSSRRLFQALRTPPLITFRFPWIIGASRELVY